MTDVARPCLLDCDQVASIGVVIIVNRGGVRQFGAKYITGGNPVW